MVIIVSNGPFFYRIHISKKKRNRIKIVNFCRFLWNHSPSFENAIDFREILQSLKKSNTFDKSLIFFYYYKVCNTNVSECVFGTIFTYHNKIEFNWLNVCTFYLPSNRCCDLTVFCAYLSIAKKRQY